MKTLWKKIWIKTLAVSRLMMIVLLLTALGFSGANAAARLFSVCPVEKLSADVPPGYKQIIPDATDPEAASDAMAPGSRPYTEQDACLVSTDCIKVNNDESHLPKKTYINIRIGFSESGSGEFTFPASSLSLISTHLGRSLTLVGAKPSGTS
jgi:hypothetical protein